ncbi:variant SH3 domain containing protein [Paecilomyces variotii No. 5]|uniref:Variant SH3 domain containing protein n=1 Tax=Byssochlamys spectabilis (strain No. 5 / NBRC 109023) TaxID=1356009 RepID=V5G943_BYSSN|nr:variant SH3 domain containing protein [Paecilomyces variotii No. 5]
MATLNLSTNGPTISRSYQSVVNAPAPSGAAASSPTYGQWAIFSVSTPLVNAFQDAGSKESVLKVQDTGEGELADLIEEFSEGRIQFAYVKVKDPNTGLPKNVLIAWCGEGVPERTKGYFTSHLAAVSKFLHGYHVQITARADGDLTPEGIVQKVADSSGSKYSAGEAPAPPPVSAATKPPVATKPVFTPVRTGGLGTSTASLPRRTVPRREENTDDDGWGADAPPVTRTQLEKVQPAYKPTKVNIQELTSQKTATTSSTPADDGSRAGVVKGGYQPIGKVDIGAIRRQAQESGQLKDDRPAPVKGAYEPVGKVDIAAIRARAQKPDEAPPSISPAATGEPADEDRPKTLAERSAAFKPSERLTSLPKPKVENKFAGSSPFTATKPPVPGGFVAKPPPAAAPVGAASRTFADQGGKTPAQLWAEKKARERGEAPAPSDAGAARPVSRDQSTGGGEWKSSYTGKSWAPVQTTHTGKSASSALSGQRTGPAEEETQEDTTSGGVGSLRDRFANVAPIGAAPAAASPPPLDTSSKPNAGRGIPMPGLPTGPVQPEEDYEAETHQVAPTPPPQPRSPTPPTPPVRESSPIRIAMPVGRGVEGGHEEVNAPPPAMPVESLQQAVPDEADLEEPAHDPARAAAETTASHVSQGGGIRALVQYDYEKAEDNEIDLREGDYVSEIEMVDQDWWLGVNVNGERGLFPSNYVEVVEAGDEHHATSAAPVHEPEPEPEAPAAPTAAHTAGGPTATALYDYEAAEDNEISFPENAKIINIDFPDEDWWSGEYNGKTGLFPANYVQLDE